MDDDSTTLDVDPNDQLVLVCGFSGVGKSASLRNIRDQESWMYLGTEAGKRLPFRNDFMVGRVTDAYEVHEALDEAIANADIKGVAIDSTTFLMEMFETQYVLNSDNTMKAWGNYAQFFKIMMTKIALFSRPTIIMAHLLDTYNEKKLETFTSVPVKGSLKNNGIEAWFSTVVSAKKIAVKELERYGSKLLTITDEERELGFKHVFQTRITKESLGEKIRSPMGMFDKAETYIDNDCQLLLDHLDKFYKKKN